MMDGMKVSLPLQWSPWRRCLAGRTLHGRRGSTRGTAWYPPLLPSISSSVTLPSCRSPKNSPIRSSPPSPPSSSPSSSSFSSTGKYSLPLGIANPQDPHSLIPFILNSNHTCDFTQSEKIGCPTTCSQASRRDKHLQNVKFLISIYIFICFSPIIFTARLRLRTRAAAKRKIPEASVIHAASIANSIQQKNIKVTRKIINQTLTE